MISELTQVERVMILQTQQRDYRIELERLKNAIGLAKFLDDNERQDAIRKEAERVAKAIEWFDGQIEAARHEKNN